MSALAPSRTAAGLRLHPLRVVQRNGLVYRRTWRGSIFFSFLQPFLFLAAMGIGLGTFVNQGHAETLGGVPYLQFLAPGLLAAACMQTATFECSWPILGKISWRRNYEAMLATPLGVGDLLLGELGWIAIRLTTVAGAFLLVIVAFGVPRSPLAILALPAAVLTGMAFAAALIAYTATQKNDSSFASLFRFVINPLFLFSGTFFPIERLPDPIEWLALLTPLYHGVDLVRDLTLGSLELLPAIGHLVYLLVFFAAGAVTARWTLTRRLVK